MTLNKVFLGIVDVGGTLKAEIKDAGCGQSGHRSKFVRDVFEGRVAENLFDPVLRKEVLAAFDRAAVEDAGANDKEGVGPVDPLTAPEPKGL